MDDLEALARQLLADPRDEHHGYVVMAASLGVNVRITVSCLPC